MPPTQEGVSELLPEELVLEMKGMFFDSKKFRKSGTGTGSGM